MNYLYLIGNGFDLAHKLPTTYQEFVFDFYLKSISTIRPRNMGDFGPIFIEKPSGNINLPNISTLSQLLQHCKRYHINIEYTNSFFEQISNNYYKERWVDIEYEYYRNILSIMDDSIRFGYSENDLLKRIIKLNTDICEIKSMLIKYLKSIDYENILLLDSIFSHIRVPERLLHGQNLFINFNYTTLINRYIKPERGDEVINIHGKLDDHLDDIIFGYGDEMDKNYPEIENLHINTFLDIFKSFGYLKKSHYQRLISIINSDFEVIIMGHSCGISDRVLLNTIFTNINCKKIHICFHEKSKTENDFFVKTQEISRHFGSANKEEMRIRIVPFDQSKPLVPYIDNNSKI